MLISLHGDLFVVNIIGGTDTYFMGRLSYPHRCGDAKMKYFM